MINAASNNSERRIHYRIMTQIPIEISTTDDTRFFSALSEDISCGGLKLSCNCDIEQFSLIILHFNIDDKNISVTARVIHKKYSDIEDYIYSYGIEFTNIGIEEQNIISQFIIDEHKKNIRGKRKEPQN